MAAPNGMWTCKQCGDYYDEARMVCPRCGVDKNGHKVNDERARIHVQGSASNQVLSGLKLDFAMFFICTLFPIVGLCLYVKYVAQSRKEANIIAIYSVIVIIVRNTILLLVKLSPILFLLAALGNALEGFTG